MCWPPSLDPTKTLLLIQFVVQAALIGVVLFLIIFDKKRKISAPVLDDLKDVIRQTEQLSESFREQARGNVDLVKGAVNELEDRIREARLVIEALEKAAGDAKQTRDFTPSDVLRLHKGGFDPLDISRITGIPLGEVQLMVKISPEG